MMKANTRKPADRTRRPWWSRAFRHAFVARQDGVTAVEFGLLAAPFFALVAAILETAFVFLSSQILDTATDTSARLLRTGQIQTSSSNTLATFRSDVCGYLYSLFDCSKLHIDVETVANFSNAKLPYPLDVTTGNWTSAEVYQPGIGSDVVLVRVSYKWPTIFNFFNFNLANTADGKRLLSSVRVFKNEPF